MVNMIKKILLDTSILVYSWDTSSPFNNSVNKALSKTSSYYIADRSLLEFYRTYTGPLLKQSVAKTLEILNYYRNHKDYTILTSTQFTSDLTFDLANKHQAKSGKIFDLNILAIAIENEMDFLYTKNIKDFPETKQIQMVDPTL